MTTIIRIWTFILLLLHAGHRLHRVTTHDVDGWHYVAPRYRTFGTTPARALWAASDRRDLLDL